MDDLQALMYKSTSISLYLHNSCWKENFLWLSLKEIPRYVFGMAEQSMTAFLVNQEVMQTLNNAKAGEHVMVLKIDLTEAYDKIR
ncbi:hypothetical protein Nepgr_025716 [Nepenthes gracilis]|uniref:Reverse transcriptase domain-containing protein n=1 Tax=Nepenthes gracilis TaxID=150966 RepID=A0AAD3T6U4_NEPGR|nr:hypothetical protein Nepgr_025716 [Nepenthes gracilis]